MLGLFAYLFSARIHYILVIFEGKEMVCAFKIQKLRGFSKMSKSFTLHFQEEKLLTSFAKPIYSPVQSSLVELRLSLKPGLYPPTPTPTRESRHTATSRLPSELKFCMEALFNQTRSTS